MAPLFGCTHSQTGKHTRWEQEGRVLIPGRGDFFNNFTNVGMSRDEIVAAVGLNPTFQEIYPLKKSSSPNLV